MGTLVCFVFVIFSSAKRVICVVVSCVYPTVNAPILYVLYRRGRAGCFPLHPCLVVTSCCTIDHQGFCGSTTTLFYRDSVSSGRYVCCTILRVWGLLSVLLLENAQESLPYVPATFPRYSPSASPAPDDRSSGHRRWR